MSRDGREPILVAVELLSLRQPGEPLSKAADRLAGRAIPDHGTLEAEAAMAGLNGRVQRVTERLRALPEAT